MGQIISNYRKVLGVGLAAYVCASKILILSSFHVGNPEGFHQLMHLFSDRGTPASIRHMNAYSGHTYKFTKNVSADPYIAEKFSR